MTKKTERDEARRLRQEQGLSILEISQMIHVSKGSVSLWVRDIRLTHEQEQQMHQRNERYGAQHAGSRANIIKHQALREQYQQEGRAKAREGDLLHAQGCMLYWAEGSKRKDSIEFANSDPDMMVFFIDFLRTSINIPEDKLSFRLNCYLNNGLSLHQITDYWLKTLNLQPNSLRKCNVQNQPVSSEQKGRKLLYGVGYITATGTRYVQHIYGAIQEYIGIDRPEWLG